MKKTPLTGQGFFLVQMVVYLALLALITLYTMQWSACASMQYATCARKSDATLTLAAITDVWVRDMREAQEIIQSIPTSFIIHGSSHDIGWHVSARNELIRIEGNYRRGNWLESSKSLMAQGVTGLKYDYDCQTRIAHMTITVSLPHAEETSGTVTRSVWLCNGCVA